MKILLYAKDGNNLIYKNMDVQELYPNIYTSIGENDCLHTIFKYNEVYLWQGQYKKSMVTDPNNKEYLLDMHKTYISSIISYNFINKLHIAHYELLGLDTTDLLAKRDQIIAERQKAKEIEAKERLLAAENAKKEYINEGQAIKNKLIAGETVTFEQLLLAIDALKCKVHPRTKGAIKKQNAQSFIGLTTGRFTNKTSNSTAQSIFDVVKSFAK